MELRSSLDIDRNQRNLFKFAESFVVLTFLSTFNKLLLIQGAHVSSLMEKGAQSEGGAATPGDGCAGGGTYYIHEYHMHGQVGEGDTSHTVIQPVFPQTQNTPTGEDLFNYTSYLEEKEQWLARLGGIERQLSDERSRRLDMMTQLVSWLVNRPSGAPSSASHNNHINILRNMLIMWSEIEEWNYTTIVQETSQPPINDTLQEELSTNIPTMDDQNDRSYTCGMCNDTIFMELEQSLAQQISKTNKIKKDMRRLQKKNLNMFNGYKRVLDATRETRRDLRNWEHRAGRLIKLYEGTFGDGTETETLSLIDEIKYLSRRVWCLEQDHVDPILCPNIKVIPLTTKSPEQQEGTIGARTTSEHELTTQPVQTVHDTTVTVSSEDVTPEHGTNPGTDIWTGNTSAVMADTIVQAGIEVSSWYLGKLRAQRPRDCTDIDFWIQRRQPVQVIYLSDRSRPVNVLCDEGWTVIMRNNPYSGHEPTWDTERDRLWHDYKYGYGTFDSDLFWFGNEYLHQLTNQDDYQLRIDMIQATDEEKVYAEYAFFKITKESDGFRLHIGDNQGSAGDILGVHSETPLVRLPFATRDKHSQRLNDIVDTYKEGWWYPHINNNPDPSGRPSPCFTHLTVEYPWICGGNGYQLLSYVVMKIRPLQDNL